VVSWKLLVEASQNIADKFGDAEGTDNLAGGAGKS